MQFQSKPTPSSIVFQQKPSGVTPTLKLNDSYQLLQADSPKARPYLQVKTQFPPGVPTKKIPSQRGNAPQSPIYNIKSPLSNGYGLTSSGPGSKQNFSTVSSALLEQRAFDVGVYNTLKEQKKFFITSGTPIHSSIQRTKGQENISEVESPNVKLVIKSKDSPSTPSAQKSDNLLESYSPRKRLAIQGQFSKKKRTVKEILIRSQSIAGKGLETQSAGLNSGLKTSKPEGRLELKSDSPRTAISIKLKKKISVEEEETNAARKLHKDSQKKFFEEITLFNKFYATYLLEPENKYNSRNDLGVKTASFIKPRTILDSFTSSNGMKRMQTTKGLANLKSSLGGIDNDKKSVQLPLGSIDNQGHPSSHKLTKIEKITRSRDPQNNTIETHNDLPDLTQEVVEGMNNGAKSLQSIHELLRTKNDQTPEEEELFNNIKEGNIFEVKSQLEKFPNLVNIKDGRNQTPLHWAVKRGLLKLVEFLCKNGANIQAVDIVGRTAVDVARRFGESKIEQILVLSLEEQESRMKKTSSMNFS